MADFPMFVDLSESAVLVVGDGPEADRKAAIMTPFCRRILRSPYPPVCEDAPAMVLLTEKDHPDNARWAAHFAKQGIPVNVADRPELCSFRFPSLIARGDVTVGISTGGKSPALAAALRRRIGDSLPENLEEIAQQAADWTAHLRKTVPNPKTRAQILRAELDKLLNE